MSLFLFTEATPQAVTATVAIESVYHVLASMALLTSPNLASQKEPWLAAAASRLTAEQRRHNRLVFEGLGAALLPAANQESFPHYLDALTAYAPIVLRDRIESDGSPQLEESLRHEVQQLLKDPPALQQRIASHLRLLWEASFSAEWQKKQSVMHFIANDLNARTWPTQSASSLMRAFIRRPIPDWISVQLGGVQQIMFIPSPYIHLHAARLGHPTTLWLFMWADPWTWPMRNEPIQRTEILGPANALADETRLRILELLAAHGEMLAQEMIAQLDVSQSTVSRHLSQLRKAGFVSEERTDDANKLYRLQHERAEQFAYTLSQLLSSENARMVLTDARLEQPAALRPFLDRNGLVTNWPEKHKGQEAVLGYLITKFALGERYTEAQVNELLKQWHTYNDPAYLRRSLIDAGLLQRTRDGAQYWR